jgi:hypothetical protein
MHQEKPKDIDDNYFQGNSFGSDDCGNEPLQLILEAKDQEIQALRQEVESVKEQLKEYKRKEMHLCELIQRLAEMLRPKPESNASSRESIRGRQEVILPFLSLSSKNWAASLRSTSPHSRPEGEVSAHGNFDLMEF